MMGELTTTSLEVAETAIYEQLKIVYAAMEKVEQAESELAEAKLQAWQEVGKLLAIIRDNKLYLEAGYRGFGPYMDDRKAHGFKIGKRHAYRLIEGVQVAESVPDSEIRHTFNPHQAEQLAKVPEAERPAVLERAAQSGKITAASIAEAAEPEIVDGHASRSTHPWWQLPLKTALDKALNSGASSEDILDFVNGYLP